MFRLIVPALALCLLLAFAGGARAGAFELGQSALLTSSERLRIFAIGRALQEGAALQMQVQLLRRDLMRQGFYHQGPPAVVDRSFSLQPQAGYDPNINGGL